MESFIPLLLAGLIGFAVLNFAGMGVAIYGTFRALNENAQGHRQRNLDLERDLKFLEHKLELCDEDRARLRQTIDRLLGTSSRSGGVGIYGSDVRIGRDLVGGDAVSSNETTKRDDYDAKNDVDVEK